MEKDNTSLSWYLFSFPCASKHDRATVQVARLENWSSFPRNLHTAYTLIFFSVGSISWSSSLFLPLAPALRYLQVATYSGNGGHPLLAAWNVCPGHLFQQNGGVRNKQLAGPQYRLSRWVDSGLREVSFSWQNKRILYQYIDSAYSVAPWVGLLVFCLGIVYCSGRAGRSAQWREVLK